MIGRRAWVVAAAGMLLAACGGARSVSGTSAANCVVPLQRALEMAPAHDQFRGLAQVGPPALRHFGFHPRPRVRAYCVVFFLDRARTRPGQAVFEIYAFTERGAVLLGSRQQVRHVHAFPDLA